MQGKKPVEGWYRPVAEIAARAANVVIATAGNGGNPSGSEGTLLPMMLRGTARCRAASAGESGHLFPCGVGGQVSVVSPRVDVPCGPCWTLCVIAMTECRVARTILAAVCASKPSAPATSNKLALALSAERPRSSACLTASHMASSCDGFMGTGQSAHIPSSVFSPLSIVRKLASTISSSTEMSESSGRTVKYVSIGAHMAGAVQNVSGIPRLTLVFSPDAALGRVAPDGGDAGRNCVNAMYGVDVVSGGDRGGGCGTGSF